MNITGLRLLPIALGLTMALFVGGCKDSSESTTADTAATAVQVVPQPPENGNYVGSAVCANCHQAQYRLWVGSHHDEAMQHASAETVKGNFNDQTLTSNGITTRFFRQDGSYFVNTIAADGEYADFEIRYTFGTVPLQQYLAEFPGGRLQALPYAWDTQKERWFNLHRELVPKPGEWVHWTGGGMNWNSMCANCHSTGLHKNFNATDDTFHSSWAEIDVACESCHGPGRQHAHSAGKNDIKSRLADLAMRPGTASQVLVDQCGSCHSRRQQLREPERPGESLLDDALPALLREGLYHSDGQIQDEVFVYGSFLQSRMYHNNVSCIDCHKPHSATLRLNGNALCAQCHDPAQFDTAAHHHHPANTGGPLLETPASKGNQCVDCHMPGRLYMTVDFRRDHSFRIPRPDLSEAFGTPNACNMCHTDQSAQWATKAIESWFGAQRKPHFSERLAAGLQGGDTALQALWSLAHDATQPAIARATALDALGGALTSPDIAAGLRRLVGDREPLLRATAASVLGNLPMPEKLSTLLPLLKDPVRAVRIAAARSTLEALPISLPQSYREAWRSAQNEYQQSLALNADFPSGQMEIAVRHHKLGNIPAAEQAYLKALQIDGQFNAARMNLAQLYYQQQRFDDAARLYRKVLEQEPEAAQAQFSLGLLLAEMGRMGEAERALQIAASSGTLPRAWYNLAVLRQRSGDFRGAEESYLKALAASPDNPEFLAGLRSLQNQTGKSPQ